MNLISTIALAMGASWTSGINLYASVATLGLLSRFAGLQLPGDLDVVTNWWVIGIASALYCVEFFADKVPWIDSTWDLIHTFIRVPAGAVLAAAAFGDFDKSIQAIAVLLGGGLALSSHGTKAATRALLNTSPEPVSNVVASVIEDILAIISMTAAIFLPYVLFGIVAIGLLITYLVLPRIFRFFKKVGSSVRRLSFSPHT
jgi:hypothetical protein